MTRREYLKPCINKTKTNILDKWNGKVREQLCKRIYLFAEQQQRSDVGKKNRIRKEEQSLAKFQHEIFEM